MQWFPFPCLEAGYLIFCFTANGFAWYFKTEARDVHPSTGRGYADDWWGRLRSLLWGALTATTDTGCSPGPFCPSIIHVSGCDRHGKSRLYPLLQRRTVSFLWRLGAQPDLTWLDLAQPLHIARSTGCRKLPQTTATSAPLEDMPVTLARTSFSWHYYLKHY